MYSTQHSLIRLIEEWKAALDNGKCVGAVLMDLSKAFDCLPHDLLIAKLVAYGLDRDSACLVADYLRGRRQRVRLSQHVSDWLNLIKGVPQGSILGPLLFNLFINDLMFILSTGSLVNFADDNTVGAVADTTEQVASCLESESQKCIKWFEDNQMSANAEKFHCIIPCAPADNTVNSVTINNTTIETEPTVLLLGVEIDDKLDFSPHLRELTRRSAFKLYAFRRIASNLNLNVKKVILNSFILSQFQYCPLVWFFCKKSCINKLDKIQERALRIVYNDFNANYDVLLKRANCPDVQTRLRRLLMVEIYKTLHDLNPVYMKNIFTLKESNYTLGAILTYSFNKAVFCNKKILSRYGGLGSGSREFPKLREGT